MEDLTFNDLRKKKVHIGFRVSEYERNQLEKFCAKEQISITDFLRFAIRKVINNKKAK